MTEVIFIHQEHKKKNVALLLSQRAEWESLGKGQVSERTLSVTFGVNGKGKIWKSK